MRIITIILIFITFKVVARNYYVSNSGNDCNNGTTRKTSWKTINKVNGFVFSNGDSILFKCDDIWNEQLKVPGSNINFSSYSTGDQPLITGFQTLCGFTQLGNVWTVTTTGVKALNTVMINGLYAYKARYPNSGYLIFNAIYPTYITTVTANSQNFIGGEVVTRTNQWMLDIRKITAQTSNTITVQTPFSYRWVYGGVGYFIQNLSTLIDSVGEFSFDSSNKMLSVYSTSIPNVQVSSIDTLVLINHKDNVTFNNISLTGANMYTFKVDTSHNLIVKNCSINYSNIGVYASKSRNLIIDNNSVSNCYSNGLIMGSEWAGRTGFTVDTCKKASIINNTLRRIGIVPGMASIGLKKDDGETTYYGMYVSGDSAVIKNNHLDSIGGMGIRFIGRKDSVCYNYVTNFAFVKVDQGGIATFQGSGLSPLYNSGAILYRNIVGNGWGNTQGVVTNNIAAGVYFDLYTNGVTIKENTVFNCLGGSLYLYNDSNTIAQNNYFEDSVDVTSRMVGNAKTITLTGNVYYQRNRYKWLTNWWTVIKNSDSNYYLRPSDPVNLINRNGFYSFPHLWQDSTGFDMNGHGQPSGITSNVGKLYINPTMKDSTISVNGNFVDARGNFISGSFVLQPYTSKTLFPVNSIPIAWRKGQ